MHPKIIACGLSTKHAYRYGAVRSLHKAKHGHHSALHKHGLKPLHIGKGVHRKLSLSDDEMEQVSHVTNKARRLVPLKIKL
jgi:hypothetical protein